MTAAPLFEQRKSLDQICKVPDKIISVYSLEQHVWAGNNSTEARVTRQAELQTIEEFQINPVRPFLNDILRGMAAPYRPDRRGEPIGQAYWIQAEFGSGKSHLLCFLAALAVGGEAAWRLVDDKERKAGRGRRESLYQFWEEGLSQKYSGDSKGIFVLVKTLVGTGGTLLLLTIVTVLATKVDFGANINLALAMVIAVTKATLVILFFMHLRYDRLFHTVVFVSAICAASLFVGFTLMDSSQYQHTNIWHPGTPPAAPVGPRPTG